jgi:F-box interacting protein
MERSRSYIPQYLLEDILVRLPVKSIIRFKCVNKSWITLFQNPTFVAKQHHHQCSIQKNPSLLLHIWQQINYPSFNSSYTTKLLNLQYSDDEDPGVSREDMQFLLEILKNPNVDLSPRSYTCHCINGIFCMGNQTDGFVLRNPAMRESKLVPKPPSLAYLKSDTDFIWYINTNTCAFGYDHNSNDYKVVRIAIYLGQPNQVHPVVHVYTLSTDSWRLIDASSFDRSITGLYGDILGEIFFNGAYHCIGVFRDESGQVCEIIVSFDMRDEVFRTIRMPDFSDNFDMKTLSVSRNCLVLIICEMKVDNFDIWMMNEYGVEESWTKQFVIGPPLLPVELPLPLHGVLVGDKLLLVNDLSHTCEGQQQIEQILLYDLITKDIKNFQVKHSSFISNVILYVESLVSITGGNVFES